MRRLVLLGMVLVAAHGTPAFAQLEQGRLTGTVADAQGAVLPGVTVTATSPSLIGTQVVVTEEDGKFLFPALPSGTYTLSFELKGFRQVKRENIVLTLGRTLTVDMQLEVAAVQEALTVTAESPIVDKTTTAVGNEFSSAELAAVITARLRRKRCAMVFAGICNGRWNRRPGMRFDIFDLLSTSSL